MRKIISSLFIAFTVSMFSQAKLEYSIESSMYYVKSASYINVQDDDQGFDELKKEYAYDEHGNVIKESHYHNDDTENWIKNKEAVFLYNTNGKVTSEVISMLDDSGTFVYNEKKVFEYNLVGDLKEIKGYYFDDEEWEYSYNTAFFYINEILDVYINQSGETLVRNKLNYTANGEIESVHESKWNGAEYVDQTKKMYYYDSENNLEEIAHYHKDADDWYHYESYLRSYDTFGNMTSFEDYIPGYGSGTYSTEFDFDIDKQMDDYYHPFKSKTGLDLGSENYAYVNKIIGKRTFSSHSDHSVLYFYDEGSINKTKDFQLNDVLIYPNPSKDFITIELPNGELDKTEIYNISGERVLVAATEIVDLKPLTNGMYLLKVSSKNGNILTKKIVKN